MLNALFWGFIFTFGGLGLLWLSFVQLRKLPRFNSFNSQQANKRMLQLSFALYFTGFVTTIVLMLN